MKGTEKIIAHIRADGDAEAKKIIDAASKQAEEKRAESFKAALSEYEKLMQAGNAECEDILSGSRRIAEMEAKKSVLSVKQEMISAAFDAAREEIVNMPRDKYTQYLARMAAGNCRYFRRSYSPLRRHRDKLQHRRAHSPAPQRTFHRSCGSSV